MQTKRHGTQREARPALLPAALLIVALAAGGVGADSPGWEVDPAAYAKQMSVMGTLSLDYEPVGSGSTVGAFVAGTCRGVAEPVQIGQAWVYFLTVYGSQEGESIGFRAYIDGEDAIGDIIETVTFASGAVHGSLYEPFQWNAILRYDFPPHVGAIPSQIIEIGGSFTDIDLDDYVTSEDGDAVAWTHSATDHLDVLIDTDHHASIVPDAGWIGSETVTFTAVEQTENQKSHSTAVTFAVRGLDHPPELSGIEDQRIGLDGVFGSFDLDDFLTEVDGDEIAWDYWFAVAGGGQDAPNWTVNPSRYSGSMTLIAAVSVRGRQADSSAYLLGAFVGDECRGVARPMDLAGTQVLWMTVYGDIADQAITLRLYDPVARDVVPVYESVDYVHGGRRGAPEAPLPLRAGLIVLEIDEGNVATPILVERDGEVSETVVFRVQDWGTLNGYAGTDEAQLSYSPFNAPPVLEPVGPLRLDEGEVLAVVVTATDPDGPPVLQASDLPEFALFSDGLDGTGILRLAPDHTQAGDYLLEIRAVDAVDASLVARQTVSLTVEDVNRPPLAVAGQDIVAPCVLPAATPVTLDGTGSTDPEGDPLSYRWLEGGVEIATGPTPTVEFSLGTHAIALVVSDGFADSEPDEVLVQVVDVTPPVIALNGEDTQYLELGTPYTDPGATAVDACDGDLSQAISSTGDVDEHVEGAYSINYTVTDAAGNAASLDRTVTVVVTANSYALIATRRLQIQYGAEVHSGFVGVVDYGEQPDRHDEVELELGPRASTASGVRVSAPRVHVRNRTTISGLLVYSELSAESPYIDIAEQQQVGPEHWPLLAAFGLPAFETGAAGQVNLDVPKNRRVELSPADGPFGSIRVRRRATLVLTGGEYVAASLQIDRDATVLIRAPSALLIADRFVLGHMAHFGPETDRTDASEILVYAAGRRGDGDRGTAAGTGINSTFVGNLYAPNGAMRLGYGTEFTGSAIAQEMTVGVRANVYLRSGWRTPGVIYEPPPAAARPVALQSPAFLVQTERGEALGNYPNPFNPSTTITYALPESGPVRLVVYNALGQQVRVLVDGTAQMGTHRVDWDGRDAAGSPVSSGVYFVRLESRAGVQVRRTMLVR